MAALAWVVQRQSWKHSGQAEGCFRCQGQLPLSHSCMIAALLPPGPKQELRRITGWKWAEGGRGLRRSCSIHADLWMSGESKRMSHNFRSAQPEGSRQPITRGSGWLKHRQRQTHMAPAGVHTFMQSQWTHENKLGETCQAREDKWEKKACVWVCEFVCSCVSDGRWQQHTSYFGQSSPREWNLKKKKGEANLSELWEETFVGHRGHESDKLAQPTINGQ